MPRSFPPALPKPKIFLRSPALPDIELESIDVSHLEVLRRWKNAHRHRFFHQTEISPDEQTAWFARHSQISDDWIFVIRERSMIVGCLGVRRETDSVDIYNVLTADDVPRAVDTIAAAMDLACSYAFEKFALPIRARVLLTNPVRRWARHRGFVEIGENQRDGLRFCHLQADPTRQTRYPVHVTELTA